MLDYRNTYQHGGISLRNDYSIYDFNQNNKIVGGSRSLDLETTNYLS
jgi:hypothetical protein